MTTSLPKSNEKAPGTGVAGLVSSNNMLELLTVAGSTGLENLTVSNAFVGILVNPMVGLMLTILWGGPSR
jgi:hypothetical protein